MSTLNIPLLNRISKTLPLIIAFCFLAWRHDLPSVAQTNFYGPKDIRAMRLDYLTPQKSNDTGPFSITA